MRQGQVQRGSCNEIEARAALRTSYFISCLLRAASAIGTVCGSVGTLAAYDYYAVQMQSSWWELLLAALLHWVSGKHQKVHNYAACVPFLFAFVLVVYIIVAAQLFCRAISQTHLFIGKGPSIKVRQRSSKVLAWLILWIYFSFKFGLFYYMGSTVVVMLSPEVREANSEYYIVYIFSAALMSAAKLGGIACVCGWMAMAADICCQWEAEPAWSAKYGLSGMTVPGAVGGGKETLDHARKEATHTGADGAAVM
ncbi:MAG: hypothetical protein KatS3mg110_3495 [Pirellulaceae bacterium]|nr:MAG: hypothetical protein KatS3mg110_3495 [Pirellulaceae bacterium]